MAEGFEIILPGHDYDLDATLASGQVFGWERGEHSWTGVVRGRWVELTKKSDAIHVHTGSHQTDWTWLTNFLQTEMNLAEVIATFPPDDESLRAAVQSCHGLRLLRQEPWECLASFILSSTKQIVQIQQIVQLLCARFGEAVPVPDGVQARFGFPSANRLASATEAELRACKMGFRAPYLHSAACAVAAGRLDLAALAGLETPQAREELLKIHGVGRKIADCVLLFAYGFQDAFPVDVWVTRALRELYFPKRRASPKRLLHFSQTYFGPFAGYAQQYLFHYVRTRPKT